MADKASMETALLVLGYAPSVTFENFPDREVNAYDAALEAAEKIAAHKADLVEALEPFARFAAAFDAKPLRGLDDTLYGIHVGTEWEALLRLSDLRNARAALARHREE